jgi:hypothetical protein
MDDRPLTQGCGLTPVAKQVGNEAIGAPNLNVAAIKHPLGVLDCLLIGIANDRFKADEMPVCPDRESPVLCHPKVPDDGAKYLGLKINIVRYRTQIQNRPLTFSN